MTELNVELQRRGEDWRIILSGELDVASAPRLTDGLQEVEASAAGDVTVDLRQLRFMDSGGLHALLNTQRRLTRQGRSLQVLCSKGDVARLLELTRLTETLGVRVSR